MAGPLVPVRVFVHACERSVGLVWSVACETWLCASRGMGVPLRKEDRHCGAADDDDGIALLHAWQQRPSTLPHSGICNAGAAPNHPSQDDAKVTSIQAMDAYTTSLFPFPLFSLFLHPPSPHPSLPPAVLLLRLLLPPAAAPVLLRLPNSSSSSSLPVSPPSCWPALLSSNVKRSTSRSEI